MSNNLNKSRITLEEFTKECLTLGITNNIYVGFSGGLDSVALLHLVSQVFLKKQGYNITAIHCNHGISDNATRWQNHCQQVAAQMGVKFDSVELDLSNYDGSLETKARNARRDYWQDQLPTDATLLLAHHLDDQVETVLYRLIRGAGVHGLSAMSPKAKLLDTTILRPLLAYDKNQLRAYAIGHDLSWVEDEQNKDLSVDRNFLRHKVLPLINSRWPMAKSNIAKAASLCGVAQQQLNASVQEDLDKYFNKQEAYLDYSQLTLADEQRLINLIRLVMQELNLLALSKDQMQRLISEVVLAKEDATPLLQTDSCVIRRYSSRLYFLQKQQNAKLVEAYKEAQAIEEKFITNNDTVLDLQYSKYQISFDSSDYPNGIKVKYVDWSKKAKKIFQEKGIPPWLRVGFPKLFHADKLVAIVGLWQKPEISISTLAKSV